MFFACINRNLHIQLSIEHIAEIESTVFLFACLTKYYISNYTILTSI